MTVQEVEVQDLVHECGKIWRAEPEVIEGYRKALTDGSMTCPVCTYPNGLKRSMKLLWQCATCRQVCLDNEAHFCFCPKKENKLTIQYPYRDKQTNPEVERRDAEIDMAKTQRILAEKMRIERNKPRDVALENNKLLKQIAKSLEHKEVKSSAV